MEPARPSDGIMQSGPLFSVVIVTRNRASSLRKALESWKAVECDSEWELIVVDNNSTDATPSVIAECADGPLPLRGIQCLRPGTGAAREAGRTAARGGIVLYVDDDCYPAVDVLRQYSNVFEEQPDIGFCGGRILLWDKTDAMVTVDYRTEACVIPPHRFYPAGTLHSANLAIRREVLEVIGGFDEMFGAGTPFPCEDIDVVTRASLQGFPGRFDPRPVVYHHHGRKGNEEVVLQRFYAQGRGAHFAKCLLDPRSRRLAWSCWWRWWRGSLIRSVRTLSLATLIPRFVELQYGIRYLVLKAARKNLSVASPPPNSPDSG